MPKASEEISKYNANSGGKTDSNLSNDALHLNGIPAEQYATKKYVQDYHGTKEAIQKEYIDEQNKSKLDEAKAYTDQVVSGQDFSNFAKVTDVQAVDTKLTNKINEDIANQKAYTDTKTQAIVNDVNNNFNNVNNAISALNDTQNELFQSVSSGKSKVAGAITDKGVATSANDTFDTMASNIRNISSGGGSTDPNYVNTADATATASDILVGKTAYAQGDKVYGTLIVQAEPGMPTYGTDTSGATATASDIAYGKTAYARGELLIGSMQNNEVTEIYGMNTDSYEYNVQQTIYNDDPVTGDVITARNLICFSKNNDYCVSTTNLNNDANTTYVESYAINENGMYIHASSNAQGNISYKKYRYTKQDLGLDDNESIISMALGAGGLDGDASKCLLVIITVHKENEVVDTTTYINKRYSARLYTYHLSENGVIGKLYDNEENVLEGKEVIIHEIARTSNAISKSILPCTYNNRWNEFIVIHEKNEMETYGQLTATSVKLIQSTTGYSAVTNSIDNVRGSYGSNTFPGGGRFEASLDDRYIMFQNNYYTYSHAFLEVDTSLSMYSPRFISLSTWYYASTKYAVSQNKFIQTYENKIKILEKTGTDTITTLKTFTLSGDSAKWIVSMDINLEATTMVIIRSKHSSGYNLSKCTLEIYDITDLFDLADGSTITPKNTYDLRDENGSYYNYYSILSNIQKDKFIMYGKNFKSGTSVTYSDEMSILKGSSNEEIIGVTYKGETFYKVSPQRLTAGQGDVRTGKTFIGWMGYPETGTMEVSE